jgi:hypothetical protein
VISLRLGQNRFPVGWNYSPEGYGHSHKKSIDLNPDLRPRRKSAYFRIPSAPNIKSQYSENALF